MKREIIFTALIAASLIFYHSAASAGVQTTPHDFTPMNGGTFQGSSDQVCIYCHTPHIATGPDRLGYRGPLWNRTLNEGATNFTMYTNSVFGALPGMDTKPTGNTLFCLSCHDGVSNLGGSGGNSIINPGGAAITFNFATIGAASTGPNDPINKMIIGRDLSNDHPVSFTYTNTIDPTGLKDPAWVVANSALRLYNGGRMECCTCHDPHELGSTTGKFPFLRVGNAGSALCLTCHNK